MATRIGRKTAEAVAHYRGLPPDVRARFEAGLRTSVEALNAANEFPAELRTALKDLLAMVLTEGFVGGSWIKVHDAFSAAWPELYIHIADLLPGSDGSRDLAL